MTNHKSLCILLLTFVIASSNGDPFDFSVSGFIDKIKSIFGSESKQLNVTTTFNFSVTTVSSGRPIRNLSTTVGLPPVSEFDVTTESIASSVSGIYVLPTTTKSPFGNLSTGLSSATVGNFSTTTDSPISEPPPVKPSTSVVEFSTSKISASTVDLQTSGLQESTTTVGSTISGLPTSKSSAVDLPVSEPLPVKNVTHQQNKLN